MKNRTLLTRLATISFILIGCNTDSAHRSAYSIRKMIDTIGFAHLDWQVDSVMNRINRTYANELSAVKFDPTATWRVAICPHDDYTYTSWQYPALLRNLKAKTIIIFGVAHKARQLNISDRIVFDNYSYWHGPYKNFKVSPIREELIAALTNDIYLVSDTLQKVEHSVESMLPFIQNYNHDAEIISILVPFMNTNRMAEISKQLSSAILKSMSKHNLMWGKDIALLITTDAVHYGDEDWGGKNMAPYGADSAGYAKAVKHEHEIIDSCLVDKPNLERVKRFIDFTVQPNNYKDYKWTWCGRYSVPLGLMTALNLQKDLEADPLNGIYIGYSTSIDHKSLPVDDLRMGKTAIATIRHWVGYASVGYR